MSNPSFFQYLYVRFRFLRYKFHPWSTLVIAPLNLLFLSGIQHTQEKIRLMKAIYKINFAEVYGLLGDFIF